jgi:ribosomal protein S18 acetylase RimI-like enzyme
MIRAYKDDDFEMLIHIFRLNTPQAFDPSEEIELIQFTSHHKRTYFTYEFDEIPAGFGGYHITENKSIARLSWQFFNPEYQKMGLGTQMTMFRLNEIKKNTEVKIISSWTSQHAFAFYEKFGFKLAEIQKDFWGDGLDLYRMELIV